MVVSTKVNQAIVCQTIYSHPIVSKLVVMRVSLSAERVDHRRYDSLLGNAGFPVYSLRLAGNNDLWHHPRDKL